MHFTKIKTFLDK